MFFVNAKIRRVLVSVVVVAWVMLGVAWWQLPDGDFHVWFLDVGQGDAIFLQSPEGHQILIDGGPGNVVLEELADVMPFFDKSIDMVVLTHPHDDHVSGLVEVLKRYDVGNVLLTGVAFENSIYEEFLRELTPGGAGNDERVWIADDDVDFAFGSVAMDVLYPFESIAGDEFDNINNSSIVVRVSYGDVDILLTGDLEEEKEAELVVADLNLSADIYKAGHHGSRTASSWELLGLVTPDIVVIQSGVDNQFDHPHPESLRNFYRIGAEIRRNDLEGTIEFVY